jgi:prepilin-type N-terminal cleavage/methylation domain-containing protein
VKRAFSLVEMMMVVLIIGILCVAMAPISIRMVRRDVTAPLHGSFECYYDDKDVLHEVLKDENGLKISDKEVDGASCTFNPNSHSLFFLINAIGGGSGGAGTDSEMKDVKISYFTKIGESDYITDVKEHKDYVFGLDKDSGTGEVDFSEYKPDGYSEDKYETAPWGWVYYRLNNMTIPVSAVLTAEGGDTNGSMLIASKKTDANCTDDNPPKRECYDYIFQRGIDGARGGRYRFNVSLKNGSTIESKKEKGVNKGIGIVFKNAISENSNNLNQGCFLRNGDDGCYYYKLINGGPEHESPACAPKTHTPEAYGEGVSCSCVDNAGNACAGKADAGGYPYTAPEDESAWFEDSYISLFGCEFSTSDIYGYCAPVDASSGPPTDCQARTCKILQISSPISKAQLFGNALNISREIRKGVNFYAQAGNAGSSRTMYVSKFKKAVIVIPGKGGDTGKAGGDTILKYLGASDDDAIMTVLGGVAPSDSKSIIAGRHFDLGDSIITYKDGDSASYDTYGSYFSKKSGDFVYPTMSDFNDAVPDSVGSSGRGAYSIFRTKGGSFKYRIINALNTYVYPSSNNVQDVVLEDAYSCEDLNSEITGVERHCPGAKGKGGAVVIVW